jgi:predicted S18 family serine protease
MDEIDKLLANLNPTPPASKPIEPASSPSTKSIEDLLSQIGASQPQISQPTTPPPQHLLEEIKADHEQQQAELHQQKQKRLEQLKQQRRSALAQKAEQWLKSLDPKSSEGKWFAEFSCNYSSQLEAAIDYLEALQELE